MRAIHRFFSSCSASVALRILRPSMGRTLDPSFYDVVVIGGGHAGCEAALAAARAGCSTLILTPNLDRIGFMPCNPSIGGPGKSHLVAEIDALGGEMARAADRAALQVRELNSSKGPAVRAIRVQADKSLYALAMKEALELQPGLHLRQDEAVSLILEQQDGERTRVRGIETRASGTITAGAIVITAGTFLRGAMIAGEQRQPGGRWGDAADTRLAGSLTAIGLTLRRFKTGTPPRIDGRTIDFGAMTPQPGSEEPCWLSRDGELGRLDLLSLPPIAAHPSFSSPSAWRPQLPCWRDETNPAAHALIRANLHRAPMFNGAIDGVGPRYCPSIEDKVARFADKPSHPVFLEPEGWRTTEYYLQGLSTSLPTEVQECVLRSIPGLAHSHVTRYGYAVEYDALDPTELTPSLESRRVASLFLAGQVNGTSGYEEAAGQGILAGLNAANSVRGRAALVLRRDQAYLGVMVDDLVSKPFQEPYRMLTSRAEHRLLLRPETAPRRLSRLAYEEGLIDAGRLAGIERETDEAAELHALFATRWFAPNPRHDAALAAGGLAPVSRSMDGVEVLRRPETTVRGLVAALAHLGDEEVFLPPPHVCRRIENDIKYGGFITKASREADRQRHLEDKLLPYEMDYLVVPGLRTEAREGLARYQPRTVGQASRLAAVTPSDLAALLVHVKVHEAAAR